MLTALDDDLDEAAERMNFVMGRLGKLLKTKSKSYEHSVGYNEYLLYYISMLKDLSFLASTALRNLQHAVVVNLKCSAVSVQV